MAAPKSAEDCVTHCHKCGREFMFCKTCTVKQCNTCDIGLAIPTPRKSDRLAHWFLCQKCFDEEGGVWWAGGTK